MQEENLSGVGARIREARRARGVTLQQLAYALGMAESSLSRLETGSVRCYVDVVLAIAEVLDIDPMDLLVARSRREREAVAAARLGGAEGARRLMALAMDMLDDA